MGCSRAVETLLPLIAQRAEFVECCAVGRRLGREDEGVWLTASLVSRTGYRSGGCQSTNLRMVGVEVGQAWDHVRHDVRLPRGLRPLVALSSCS